MRTKGRRRSVSADLRAANEAALALHDRTVDAVAAGEQQPGSDHRFVGRWPGDRGT
ncbi:DUF6805 domain-containing protein [Streptomyces sp. T12]|uniref:DUF6805 domain-containing protein n=1 Tax=Streptomyces sp. T12 TaxID=477697 RepID=UPI0035A2ADF5